MLIRRALALSALLLSTAIAGGDAPPPARVITLSQAIAMALRSNIDIQWYKTDLKVQDAQIRLAWADFDPALTFSSSYQYSRTPENPTIISSADTAQQILLEQEALAEIQSVTASPVTPLPVSTAPYIFQNEDFDNSLNFQGKIPFGTTYKLGVQVDHLRDTVLGLNQQFLPSDVFFAGLSIDQPLLQGFGYDANLVSVRIGRRNRQVGANNWRQGVIDSVSGVMATYFDMTYARELMRLRQQSIDDARALAQANQRRVDVGLMTPLDVRQAQVDVSAGEYDFLTAKNLLAARVADLKKLIYRGVEQDDGRTFLPAGPADLPVPTLDRETLLADAFRNRVDYATAIQQSAIEDIRLKYYQNQALPKIDVVATLGVNGLNTGSTGSSISNALSGQGPEWMFGIQGSIPLGNIAGRANLAASRRLKEEAVWKLKKIELAINTDVDTAISAIRTNQQRLAAAREAGKVAEEVVRMQTRRITEGQGSTFDLLDNRRRLYDAQATVLAAVDDLNKSVLQLYLATGTLLRQESIQVPDDEPEGFKDR